MTSLADNLMTAEGQQAELFKRLDRLFADSPDYVVNNDEDICCTRVGEWLMDHCSFSQAEADELAFEWADQPKYAQYSPTRNL